MGNNNIKPGDRFHRLVALGFDHTDKRYRSYFKFKCDCGTEKVILSSGVKSGNTKSCGCLSKEVLKSRRISENHSEVTAIVLGYKRHAADRKLEWLLGRVDVENIIKLPCYYCGQPPSNTKKTKNSIGNGLKYSGIDRIDSNIGYTINNVVPCCKICNYAKSNMLTSDFQDWAIRIGKNAMAGQWGQV